jgi:hypothetical protein
VFRCFLSIWINAFPTFYSKTILWAFVNVHPSDLGFITAGIKKRLYRGRMVMEFALALFFRLLPQENGREELILKKESRGIYKSGQFINCECEGWGGAVCNIHQIWYRYKAMCGISNQ